MVNRSEWCPGLKEDAYEGALGLAWAKLAEKDLMAQAKLAGATIESGKVKLVTFNRECIIDPMCHRITMDGREVKELGAILILHYLTNAISMEPTGKAISYRQLPGGGVFYPAFKSRVIEYIGATFHEQPNHLIGAAKLLGGKKLALGDASMLVPVFPKLPLTVIVWKSDDEVRGTANVLFDESASKFMNTEDLAAVGTFLVSQLTKARATFLRDVHSINTV
jgi:hypothetical protein